MKLSVILKLLADIVKYDVVKNSIILIKRTKKKGSCA